MPSIVTSRGPGQCIFCGGPGLTKEDIFPRWLKILFPEQNLRHVMESKDFGILKIRSAAPLRLTARIVCAACNNGWMSALEERAKPLLLELIPGALTTLGSDAQTDLAVWAVLKGYTFRYAARPVRPVPQPWLQALYAHRGFPPSTVVWLARYQGEAVCRVWTRPLILRRPSVPSEYRDGELFTLALGQVVMQVAFIDYDGLEVSIVRPPDFDRFLVPVWPPSKLCRWPPSQSLTDQDLDHLSRSLITSGAQ